MSTTIPRTATRMLDHCTVCGVTPDDAEVTGPGQERHMAHDTPVCEDCGVCLDLWGHDADCAKAPLPEVIALGTSPGGTGRWMVASKSVAPGAYWAVSLTHEGAASVMHCPCPAGRRLEGVPLPERRGCRHLVAVVRFVNNMHRRPAMPCNPSAWVD